MTPRTAAPTAPIVASTTASGSSALDQACQASFYVGALALISGDKEIGRRDLTAAATTCPKSAFERGAAQVMLDR